MLMRSLSWVASCVAVALIAVFMAAFPSSRVENANAYFQEGNIRHSGLVGTRTLALTFDDGPSAFTGELLETLSRHDVKATFFLVGTRVRHHRATMERMANDGHVIANHSFSHAQLGRKYAASPEMLLQQVAGTNDAITPYLRTGQGLYFRAPYGVWRQVHAQILNADESLRHYVGPVYWDIGGQISLDDEGNVRASADWDCWSRDWSAEKCARGYIREIERKQGGIVLMHDIRERSIWMMQHMLPILVDKGYRFVTLDEVKALDQFKVPPMTEVPVAEAGGFPASGMLAQ